MSCNKLGRYDLLRVLGKGAMGLVYEGLDPSLDRRVAIKTIRVENLSEQAAADYEARFRVEARAAARLQHPNIVSVYDAGRDGDVAFLVMEFIQGDDLKHHLDQGLRHSLAQTVAIMGDLLSALDYAHRQGVIHRDIKPANLLIEADGRAKLADFGVARMQDSGDATRTQGTMVGTLKYMSPEQVQGRPVDARADLFAAGIVLYQLLTGKRPFDADSDFAVIQQVVGHSPALPSALNPELPLAIDAVVATALAKSRDLRFASAQDFAAALRTASQDADDSTIVPPASPARKAAYPNGTPNAALVGLQSDISLNLSALTQEVELVYWKDIKESSDIKDIQSFLAKFPVGIYADLAMRRLRNLGVQSGQVGKEPLDAATATTAWATFNQTAQLEKTVYIDRKDELPAAASAAAVTSPPGNAQRFEETIVLRPVPAPPVPALPLSTTAGGAENETLPALAFVSAGGPATAGMDLSALKQKADVPTAVKAEGHDLSGSPTRTGLPLLARSRRWRALLGGIMLVAFGLSAKILWPVSATPISQAESLSDREEILIAAPPLRPPDSAAVTLLASASASASANAAEGVPASSTASLASVPSPDTAKLATDKKSVNEKKSLKKTALLPAPELASAGGKAATQAQGEPAATARRSAAADPRLSCEDRLLIAFEVCMVAQCSKPASATHPVCVERRAMDQRRREVQQLR